MVKDVLEAVSAWEAVAWIALVIAILVGIFKALPKLRVFAAFLDGVSGKPARFGKPAEPGLFERLENIEARQATTIAKLDVVNHELFPNSGKSLRDQTNRIEEKLDRDNERIGKIETVLEDHLVVSNAIIEKIQEE